MLDEHPFLPFSHAGREKSCGRSPSNTLWGIDHRFPSVLSAECVEVDDFYIEVRSKGIRECGTKQQPMLTAMDRAAASCAAWMTARVILGNSSNTTTSVICPRSVPMPGVGYRQGWIASVGSSRKSRLASPWPTGSSRISGYMSKERSTAFRRPIYKSYTDSFS